MNTKRPYQSNIPPSEAYERVDNAVEVADVGENIAWVATPEQTAFFPEIENESLVCKFLNSGGLVLIFLGLQFLLHAEKTYIAAKESYNSTNPKEQIKWFYRAIENVFKTIFIGLATVSSFFFLSVLMLPAFTILSGYDVLSDIYELWTTRNNYQKAKSEKELEKIKKKRNELWKDLLIDTVTLALSVLSCLNAPILYSIGTVGCLVMAIVPYLPEIWSGIKSFCHWLTSTPEKNSKPASRKQTPGKEPANSPTYHRFDKHHLIDKPTEKHATTTVQHHKSEHTHNERRESFVKKHSTDVRFFKKNPQPSSHPVLHDNPSRSKIQNAV